MKKIIIIIIVALVAIFGIYLSMLELSSTKSQSNMPLEFSPTPTPLQNLPTNLPQPSLSTGLSITNINPADKSIGIPVYQSITVTFNQPIDTMNFSVTSHPQFEYTTEASGENLTISLTSQLESETTYRFTINTDGFSSAPYSFTTLAVPSSVTDQSDIIPQQELESAKYNQPDVYLFNYMPYQSSTFSVTSDFTSNPTQHYFFTVKLIGSSGKQDFLHWLQSLGLGSTQIQSLDIRYQ